jgi:hypothetical protein
MTELRGTIRHLKSHVQRGHPLSHDFANGVIAGLETVDGRLAALEELLTPSPRKPIRNASKNFPYRDLLRRKAKELLKLAPQINDATLRERVARLAKGIMEKTVA